jgi:cobyrinic acid a,c-diamide synthase
MVSADCPRLVIAGTASGVGKTSLVLGLARELARRGLRVQTFKVGPDFLDPTWLALASGRTCYNLDGWMTSREYVCELFARAAAGADIALIEGVMGLFDGASPVGLEGSTAEVAAWLDAPLLLVVPARGAGRSLAATVQGFARFEPGIRIAGVIANQGGSARHRAWLAEALGAAGLPPLVGAVPRGVLPPLPSRHLGLVTADPGHLSPPILDQLADACREHLDVAEILRLSGVARSWESAYVVSPGRQPGDGVNSSQDAGYPNAIPGLTPGAPPPVPPGITQAHLDSPPAFRLGVAWDEAFHFYYADNLESLQDRGVEICRFSPLADAGLPPGLDGLYLGGGYPELYAARLAANHTMLCDVRAWAASGRPLYAECGGLMYLGRSLLTHDGARHAMAGVLPVQTVMLDRLKTLGYVEVSLRVDSLWGPAGAVCRGHEFHYSEIAADGREPTGSLTGGTSLTGTDGYHAQHGPRWSATQRVPGVASEPSTPFVPQGVPPDRVPTASWSPAYTVRRLRGEATVEGFARGNVLASYVHLHWASRPEAADRFVAHWAARPETADRIVAHSEATA